MKNVLLVMANVVGTVESVLDMNQIRNALATHLAKWRRCSAIVLDYKNWVGTGVEEEAFELDEDVLKSLQGVSLTAVDWLMEDEAVEASVTLLDRCKSYMNTGSKLPLEAFVARR